MDAWLLNKSLLAHKVSRAGQSVKRLTRKKSKPSMASMVKQSIKIGKKLALGMVKFATLIFIGRL